MRKYDERVLYTHRGMYIGIHKLRTFNILEEVQSLCLAKKKGKKHRERKSNVFF